MTASSPSPCRRSRSAAPQLWMALTGLTLALTACACVYITLIFLDPRSPLNPFPPATRTATSTQTLSPGTATSALSTLPPAWTSTPVAGKTEATRAAVPGTPTATQRPTDTATLAVTVTPAGSRSPTATLPPQTPQTPSATPSAPATPRPTVTESGSYPGVGVTVFPTPTHPAGYP